MFGQFIKRLITKLDSSETDCRITLGTRRVELPQRKNRLAVRLLVESHKHPEPTRVIVPVRSVLDFDEQGSGDIEEFHPVTEANPIFSDHVEPPDPALPQIELVGHDC